MAPPRISDKQWRELEPRIKELFRRGVPLRCKDLRRQTVSQALQEEYGLAVTVSQLEARLKEWDVAKNLRLWEWKKVMPRLDELESRGVKYQLRLAGQEVKKSAIQRARRSLRAKSLAGESQASVSSEAKCESQARQISIMIPGRDGRWVPYPEVGMNRGPGSHLTVDQDRDIAMEDRAILGPQVDAPRRTSPSPSAQHGLVPFSPNLNASIERFLSSKEHFPGGTVTPEWMTPDSSGALGPINCNDQILDFNYAPFQAFAQNGRLLSPVNDPSPCLPNLTASPPDLALSPVINSGSTQMSILSNQLLGSSHSLFRLIFRHVRYSLRNEPRFSVDSTTRGPLVPQHQPSHEVEKLLDPLLSLLPEMEAEQILNSGTESMDPASKIRKILLHSIVNNFAGLGNVPLVSVLAALRSDSQMRSELFDYLRRSLPTFAKSIADGLFKAAVESSDVEAAKLVIAAGRGQPYTIRPDDIVCEFEGVNYTAVELAAFFGDIDMVNVLLHLGADVNKSYLVGGGAEIPGALKLAILPKSFSTLQALGRRTELLDNIAELDVPQAEKILFFSWPNIELVQALLDHGAQVDGLHVEEALSHHSPDIKLVQVLLNHVGKASAVHVDKVIRSHWPNKELLQTLLEHGAEVNSGHLETAIECRRLNKELLNTLLEHGAEVDSLHLEIAIKCNQLDKELLQTLLDGGAKVEARHVLMAMKKPKGGLLLQLLQRLPPTDHHRCCEPQPDGFSLPCIIADLHDNQEAVATYQMLLKLCIRDGCGRCTIEFSHVFTGAFVAAARRGNLQLCEILSKHRVAVTAAVLSAAIRGRDLGIIDLCLNQGFDLKEPASQIEEAPYRFIRPATSIRLTTPLAEAIRVRDHQLLTTLEERGAFHFVRDIDSHFQAAATAAAEVGDVSYLERILAERPRFGPSLLAPAVITAVLHGATQTALVLLDAGVNESEEKSTRYFHPGRSALAAALTQRNKPLVYAILESDVDFSAVGDSLLELAVAWGDASLIKDLIHMGANISGEAGRKALTKAVVSRRTDLVSLFLAKGADPGATDLERDSPVIFEAIKASDEETIQLLLSKGSDPTEGIDYLQWIDTNGSDSDESNSDEPVSGRPSFDGPILHLLLKAFKARYPQGRPGFKTNALINAIKNNSLQTLDALLTAGLDVNSISYTEYNLCNPLGFAIRHSADPNLIVSLIRAGADVNGIAAMPNGSGSLWSTDSDIWPREPALLVAIEKRNEAMVAFLLERGADVNCPARLGVKRTPLQAACEIGSWCIVKLLLGRDADVHAPPARRGGGTALQLAAMGGYVRIVQLLLSRGASVHESPSRVNGRTALEAAAENGRLNMLAVLWESRQGAGFPDDEIRRAIGYANKKGQRGCADYISWLWTTKPVTMGLSGEASGDASF